MTTPVAIPRRNTSIGTQATLYVGDPTLESEALTNPRAARAVREWATTLNDGVTPTHVRPDNTQLHPWWVCENPRHPEPYQATIAKRMTQNGCPRCEGKKWTAAQIVALIERLDLLAPELGEADRIRVLEAAGAIKPSARDALTVATEALVGGILPESAVREILENPEEGLAKAAETLAEARGGHVVMDPETGELTIEGGDDPEILTEDGPAAGHPGVAAELPSNADSAESAMTTLGTLASAFHDDERLVEYLIARTIAKLWDEAYVSASDSTTEVRAKLASMTWTTKYQQEAAERWITEADAVDTLTLPVGYSFTDEDDEPALPNLMQKHLVVRLRDRGRLLNLSGTGTGKTLAAVLASRVLDSPTTLVVCPLDTVGGWRKTFSKAFPGVEVQSETLAPRWMSDGPKALIVNIDKFSTAKPEVLRALVRDHEFGLIVVDEGHLAKQRGNMKVSARSLKLREVILGEFEENPGLRVLVQTATPVLNDLREGYSILELALPQDYSGADARPTGANAARLYGEFVQHGIRSRRKPEKELHDPLAKAIEADRSDTSFYGEGFAVADYTPALARLQALGARRRVTPLDLEFAVLSVKAPAFAEAIVKALAEDRAHNPNAGIVAYSHYVGNDAGTAEATLAESYASAIRTLDPTLRVETYTGIMSGSVREVAKKRYLEGHIDVLVASSPIGTGVDGLQKRTRTLVMATLPPTSAQYEQVVGRVHRQGQKYETRVIHVRGELTDPSDGSCYSPEIRGLRRVARKRTLADAAVDGTYPDGGFVSDEKAAEASLDWIDRLRGSAPVASYWDEATLDADFWDAVSTHLAGAGPASKQAVLTRMNARWCREHSSHRRGRFADEGTAEWEAYHKAYRAARAEWSVLPVDLAAEFVSTFTSVNDTVFDLGAGEALLADRLPTHANLRSFDHVSTDPRVEVADITGLPVGDEATRVVVLSLAVMGKNDHDYLREAARVLHMGGWLWLAEPTKRFHGDFSGFRDLMRDLGFSVATMEQRGSFTIVTASKIREAAAILPEWHFGHEGGAS